MEPTYLIYIFLFKAKYILPFKLAGTLNRYWQFHLSVTDLISFVHSQIYASDLL